jgi:hypothetical protein
VPIIATPCSKCFVDQVSLNNWDIFWEMHC